MKDILTNNEEVLLTRCDEIDTISKSKEMREIVHEIKDTMRKKELKHLSAPAIGYDKRIFCIDYEDLEIKTYINPIIVNLSGLTLSRETCSSILGKTFLIPRCNDIAVMYQTPMGKSESKQLLGVAAIVFQHELNHLDGILLSDIGLEIDEEYDNASEEDKQKIIEMYLDSLDIKTKELNTEVESDPDLKKINDGIKFMEGVAKGEIKQH